MDPPAPPIQPANSSLTARVDEDALLRLQKVAGSSPRDAGVHFKLGLMLHGLGRCAEAAASYRHALTIRPDLAEIHNNLGNALRDLGRAAESEGCYRRALEARPDFALAWGNLGNALRDLGRPVEAESCYRRAIEIRPELSETYNNLATVLADTGRPAEAEHFLRLALRIQPDFVEALSNLASTLDALGRLEEAENCYRRCLEIRPEFAQGRVNFGVWLLASGRYEEGWLNFDSGLDKTRADRQRVIEVFAHRGEARWRGEPLAGRSLLMVHEAGFGDAIFSIRYAALLKQQKLARLSVLCPPALALLLGTAAGVDAALTDFAAAPPHDFWSFPFSLPRNLGTRVESIPASLPYLHPLPERQVRWRDRLPASGLRVGLVWRGNVSVVSNAHRSLPGLATLAPLWSVARVSFVSLQKDSEEEAHGSPAGQPLLALGPEIRDFADTAGILAGLDLVISIDTAVAQLAGALGKPVWVLLPAVRADWRWMRGRGDSPWYPGVMRLFRQPRHGDWSTPVAELAAALREWASGAR